MAGRVSVVVGGQFGSEAKGAVAGYLAERHRNSGFVVCVRVGGPNAGHTVYGSCPVGCKNENDDHEHGHPWRLRQVPVAAVTNPNALLLIAAGSEVDFTVLAEEMRQLNSAGYQLSGRLYVDGSATALTSRHIEEEGVRSLNSRIGSTAKGIGAARADRIWRTAELAGWTIDDSGMPLVTVDSTSFLTSHLDADDAHVIIEGTQGYGLGLHTDYYPTVTSGDCRAIDFLAQAGLSPWSSAVAQLDVWVVARTYPIRVAGNSGPLAGEMTWDEVGVLPEKTTVTQKIRRVGEWDPNLVRQAIAANGGPAANVKLALTMVDYKIPKLKGAKRLHDLDGDTQRQLMVYLREIEGDVRTGVSLVGTGPTSIIDLRPTWTILG